MPAASPFVENSRCACSTSAAEPICKVNRFTGARYWRGLRFKTTMYHGADACLIYWALLNPAKISSPKNLGVKAPAALDVIALERAVGESLRQVAAFGKALVGERLIPMAGGVRAAVLRAAGIVIFDLQVIAAGLAKIDRVSEVRALRLGDFAEVVFLFVGLDVFPGGFDFFMVGDAKAVVIVESSFPARRGRLRERSGASRYSDA